MEIEKMKLFSISEKDANFPPYTTSVWATESDIRAILPNGVIPDRQPNYVKIVSRNQLSQFTFYAKIDSLNNSKGNYRDGQIWIPRRLMDRTWIYEQNMDVEVSYLELAELSPAEVVTVKLNPKEVMFWSESEESAARSALTRNGVAYLSQKVMVKPRTKDNVMGEIISIFPKPKAFDEAYRIDNETRIVFEGLPANKQKTIDFSKIGGLDNVIKRLREIIQIPISFPEILEHFGINPPKGMILYGPPGNGKTMIARAVAQTMGASFIEIDRSELLSKYVGDSEKKLEEAFREAAAKGNSVIFIDELDSLASSRNEQSAEHQVSLVATLLVLMDGMNSSHRVFVIGATNRLEAVDPALRRPGRFDLEFEVPLPDTNGRYDILRKYVPLHKPELLESNIDEHSLLMLSELTSGYSGADMSMLYREAAMQAIRRNMKFDEVGKVSLTARIDEIKLRYDDFIAARKEITPTQMRGEQAVEETVTWEEIVGLDRQKETLTAINTFLSKCIDSDVLQNRPSCANILLSGCRGTGKRTLTTAFAKKFGYELMSIDCFELESRPVTEMLQEIHRIIIKCRQSAPSVLLIRNLIDCQNKETIGRKITNELSRLSRRLKLVAVLTADDPKKLPQSILGYKGFETAINLDIAPEQIVDGLRKLFPETGADCTVASVSGRTIGQAIRDWREKSLLNNSGIQSLASNPGNPA